MRDGSRACASETGSKPSRRAEAGRRPSHRERPVASGVGSRAAVVRVCLAPLPAPLTGRRLPSMQDRTSESTPASTLALTLGMLRESSRLVGRTLDLARTEIDGNIRALIGLLALLGTIVVLLVAAFFVFLDAMVKALTVLIGSEVVAALVVASPFLVAAGLLAAVGLRRIARATRIVPPKVRGQAALATGS
ncbi:phage holin family protein [Methylobacterium sp. WL103]|nr:phage holin family protein [Methylobacterium sp. WL103]